MDIKNLKITQKGRRLLSTVAVVLTISPFLNAHAYALDKDVSVNTNTTISESKDVVLKTTTYLVEFNETRRFNDELSAKSKKNAYEIKQKAIKDEVVKNGGFYNYSVNISKIYESEVSTTYKVDCNNLNDLENQIKILKNYKVSNCEIIETDSKYIISATFDKEVYYVDTTRINKGYDYVVIAIKKVPLYESTHELDINIASF